jgi:uncharacterized protein (DUF302 family)
MDDEPARLAVNPYERIEVAASAERTVQALHDALRSRAITEYVLVDHGHDMSAAGVRAHAAWTAIFGNPIAGEPLLAADLAAAVDIPLRLAVIGNGPGASAIILRPMATLLDPSLGEIADGLTRVLRTVAVAARDKAEAGS